MRTAGRWPPLILTRPTPGSCEIFCARRVSARSSTWVSGIDLSVYRRRRQIRRQQIAGCIDRRLDLLLGHVETEVETELQRYDRGTRRTRRRHLVEARHLPELHFERGCDRRGHHVGTGAGVKRLDLYRRVIDLRQCRERQEAIGEEAHHHDRRHQQRRRYRSQDKQAGGAHFNSDNSRITERGRSRGASPLAATLPLLIVLRLGGALSGGVRDLLACRWRLSGGGVRDTAGMLGRGQRHLGAVAQPVGAVNDDAFSRLQAGQDRNMPTVGRSELYLLNRNGVVRLNEVDERTGRTALYRCTGDDINIVEGIDDQLDIDELVGK